MGKRAEQSKKRKRAGNSGLSKPSIQPAITDVSELDDHLISLEDLETTVMTLETLAESAEELSRKDVKDVKRAVYSLQRVMADGMTLGEYCKITIMSVTGGTRLNATGTSLSSRISTALQDYRFTDALILLFEMYTRKLPPKLGSLQRWVRECDATVSASGEDRDSDAMKCLDLILRIANPSSIKSATSGNELIRRKATWSARDAVPGEIDVWGKMKRGDLFGGSH